jgi:DNA-binding HxlR family transcriptional regulator
LRAARLVVHDANGYSLGEEGQRLLTVLLPLNDWAAGWAAGAK